MAHLKSSLRVAKQSFEPCLRFLRDRPLPKKHGFLFTNNSHPFVLFSKLQVWHSFEDFHTHDILKVLSLYGVDSLSIDGDMTFEKRHKIVFRFHEPDAPRVFIFSSVGTAGLNLALAHIVIFLVRVLHTP
jgi:hypothetical protein